MLHYYNVPAVQSQPAISVWTKSAFSHLYEKLRQHDEGIFFESLPTGIELVVFSRLLREAEVIVFEFFPRIGLLPSLTFYEKLGQYSEGIFLNTFP